LQGPEKKKKEKKGEEEEEEEGGGGREISQEHSIKLITLLCSSLCSSRSFKI
jgi:hypothetical protein